MLLLFVATLVITASSCFKCCPADQTRPNDQDGQDDKDDQDDQDDQYYQDYQDYQDDQEGDKNTEILKRVVVRSCDRAKNF